MFKVHILASVILVPENVRLSLFSLHDAWSALLPGKLEFILFDLVGWNLLCEILSIPPRSVSHFHSPPRVFMHRFLLYVSQCHVVISLHSKRGGWHWVSREEAWSKRRVQEEAGSEDFFNFKLSDVSSYTFDWAEVKIEGMHRGIFGMQLSLQLSPLHVIYRVWGFFGGWGLVWKDSINPETAAIILKYN